jgi:HSP20 family protein
MNMMRWDPFDEGRTLRRSIDRLFDDVLTTHPGLAALEWAPAVEMFETEQAVVVRAEMPNIDPKQVGITVTDETITLKRSIRHEEEHKSRNYYQSEIRYGEFARTLSLAAEVKSAEARAMYKNGVLEVTLPKSERVKPTSVKVQIG